MNSPKVVFSKKVFRSFEGFFFALSIAGLCIAVTAPRLAFAQNADSPESRWQQLPESEKQRLREAYQRWQTMAPEEKSKLQENYDRYQAMDPAMKEHVRNLYQRFKSLPPEQQQKIRENYSEFAKLPQAERQKRLEQLRESKSQGNSVKPATSQTTPSLSSHPVQFQSDPGHLAPPVPKQITPH